MPEVLSQRELDAMHAYWRAANYLSVGQMYLYDNPLLEKPFSSEHDLHLRPWAWRAGDGRQCLPRGDLQRGLPQHRRRLTCVC